MAVLLFKKRGGGVGGELTKITRLKEIPEHKPLFERFENTL